MSGYLLSICISSYNKGNRTIDLLNKIRTLHDPRIQIVICDDASDESTRKTLEKIRYNNCRVFYNSRNLGACKNWFETLDKGDGNYLLHVLDRDYIDIAIIVDFLDFLEKESVGVGCIGRGELPGKPDYSYNGFGIYRGGLDTSIKVTGTFFHPTGFIIKKEIWDSKRTEFKEYFYDEEKYGMYPHTILVGVISQNHKVISGTRRFYKYVYSMEAKSSSFYNKSSSTYWWKPQCIYDNTTKLINELASTYNAKYKAALITNIFDLSITRATFGYAESVFDEKQMRHYGLRKDSISSVTLLLVSCNYAISFCAYLYRRKILTSKLLFGVMKTWMKNVEMIIRNY